MTYICIPDATLPLYYAAGLTLLSSPLLLPLLGYGYSRPPRAAPHAAPRATDRAASAGIPASSPCVLLLRCYTLPLLSGYLCHPHPLTSSAMSNLPPPPVHWQSPPTSPELSQHQQAPRSFSIT
eukprot:2047144-Rhodomonas_salina.1